MKYARHFYLPVFFIHAVKYQVFTVDKHLARNFRITRLDAHIRKACKFFYGIQ